MNTLIPILQGVIPGLAAAVVGSIALRTSALWKEQWKALRKWMEERRTPYYIAIFNRVEYHEHKDGKTYTIVYVKEDRNIVCMPDSRGPEVESVTGIIVVYGYDKIFDKISRLLFAHEGQLRILRFCIPDWMRHRENPPIPSFSLVP